MSFRARLTTFFVLIVVIPMAAMGVLVFGLVDNSASSQADSRVAGTADAAASVYRQLQPSGEPRRPHGRPLVPAGRVRAPARAGARVRPAWRGSSCAPAITPVSVGDRTAIAPGIAIVRAVAGRPRRAVAVAELTAAQFARQLAGADIEVVVRARAATLGTSEPAAARRPLPARRGTVELGSHTAHAITQRFTGFGAVPVAVTVLSAESATGGALTRLGPRRRVHRRLPRARVLLHDARLARPPGPALTVPGRGPPDGHRRLLLAGGDDRQRRVRRAR